ncbi:hypothetical protein, partial [Lacticaseibacillus mingshuiensis]|uniref:hypothetical protein n=1 Tax=Lacticaseibacillus mingshuiensis TaxID=2799574 RepID=UPI001941EB7D
MGTKKCSTGENRRCIFLWLENFAWFENFFEKWICSRRTHDKEAPKGPNFDFMRLRDCSALCDRQHATNWRDPFHL